MEFVEIKKLTVLFVFICIVIILIYLDNPQKLNEGFANEIYQDDLERCPNVEFSKVENEKEKLYAYKIKDRSRDGKFDDHIELDEFDTAEPIHGAYTVADRFLKKIEKGNRQNCAYKYRNQLSSWWLCNKDYLDNISKNKMSENDRSVLNSIKFACGLN